MSSNEEENQADPFSESAFLNAKPHLDLPFTSPVTNAAGTLGFNPSPRGLDLSGLGGFITNPISLAPRSTASGVRFGRVPAGVLLHTGHPNPGARKIIRKHRERWERSELPVVAHLLSHDPDDLYRLVRTFEDVEGIAGLEIGIPSEAGTAFGRELVQAAIGELPVIARVPVDRVRDEIDEIADSGASALSFGPMRGGAPLPDGRAVSGRLYGPGVFTYAYEVLQEVRGHRLPVIFAGGMRNRVQIDRVLDSGAAGFQLDLAIWDVEPLSVLKGWSSDRG